MDLLGDLAPTGSLRASINLGNPVLAQGTKEAPSGVTVDIARELGRRLGVPVELACFPAARESFEALSQGQADICFLAVEPAREEVVAFTAPYVVIEGVFVVPDGSTMRSPADVDQPGVRIGVNEGSAYDLFLTRTLTHAQLVRTDNGLFTFSDEQLEAAAGVRQSIEAFVASHPGVRVIEPRFMEIQQAVGTSRARDAETVSFLRRFVEELKADGFIADALRRAGQQGASVAPAAGTGPLPER
ncbi:MAG: transporter substrate-binding domain-containing protein [Acidimicrobiales bacterium]|nr:transporter substrate-binding domain-containing protein [Acidimicrobiales bacterium]